MRRFLTISALVIAFATPIAAHAEGLITSGEFRNADANHRGSGMASISQAANGQLSLSLSNFQTIPGPDLKVWLIKAANVQNSDDVKASEYVSLGALKSPDGDQEYAIPADVKVDDYKSVAIWCEQFGVLFTTADLMPAP